MYNVYVDETWSKTKWASITSFMSSTIYYRLHCIINIHMYILYMYTYTCVYMYMYRVNTPILIDGPSNAELPNIIWLSAIHIHVHVHFCTVHVLHLYCFMFTAEDHIPVMIETKSELLPHTFCVVSTMTSVILLN